MTCTFCGRQATHEIRIQHRESLCCERCWQKLKHVLEDEEDDLLKEQEAREKNRLPYSPDSNVQWTYDGR